MLRFTLPDGWYGPGTVGIRNILLQLQSMQWFALVPNDNLRTKSVTLVERYLDCLRGLDNGRAIPRTPSVVLLEGDWSLLHQGRWGVDPYNPWGDRWNAADESLGRIIRSLTDVVDSSPVAGGLVRPPLWPVANQSAICGQALVALPENLKEAGNLTPGGRDWCVAWALLCKAEAHVWNALLWELALATGTIQGRNPFQELLDLYELGAYPMGWVGNCYELYVPKISRDASV